jgi:hypothetical protein
MINALIKNKGFAMKFIAQASGVVTNAYISNYTNPIYNYYVYSNNISTNKPDTNLGPVGTVSVASGTTYWLVLDFGV